MINRSFLCIAAVLIAFASSTSAQGIATYGECSTPNGDHGTCVHLENCTFLYNMLQKRPLSDGDRQFLLRSQCGSENRNVLVCCREERATTKPPQVKLRGLVNLMTPTTPTTVKESIATYGECITPSGEHASCIHLEQCTFALNLMKKKPLLREEIEFLRRSQCGSYKGKVLVCCNDKYTPPRRLLPEPGVCGSLIMDRIHGGTVAKIDEFPWMALILYNKGNQVGHHCGGSLINDRYVLTAAHCIERMPLTWKPIGVRLGEWNTSTNHDCVKDILGFEECALPHVDIPIESIITHPSYVSTSKNQLNDIALLRLSRSVSNTDFIRPICLPISDYLKDISLDGTAMDIAGWGYTENGTKSNLKLKAVVHGVPLRGCQRVYGSRRFNIHLGNSQICAGGQRGVDTCKGDSGGALVALDTSNKSRMYYYLAGIISFGPTTCGLQGWPGVYTKVSNYVDWIQKNLEL